MYLAQVLERNHLTQKYVQKDKCESLKCGPQIMEYDIIGPNTQFFAVIESPFISMIWDCQVKKTVMEKISLHMLLQLKEIVITSVLDVIRIYLICYIKSDFCFSCPV